MIEDTRTPLDIELTNHGGYRFLEETLPEGSWKGRSCFMIGGGPSLKDFDPSLLDGRLTIGINPPVLERFNPTILYLMDLRALNWARQGLYGETVRQRFEDYSGLKVFLLLYSANLPPDFYVLKAFGNFNTSQRRWGMSFAQGLGTGNNSGYAALNLAFLLGADPVYLLGYDMKHEPDRTHWHAGHPVKQTRDQVESFIPHFNRAARFLRRAGRTVINLNPDSALVCFPKKTWEEALG
jgi:hypothetical protein